MLRRFLTLTLVVLVVANIAVAIAWLFRDDLEARGVLSRSAPRASVDLPSRPLPEIGALDQAVAQAPAASDRAPSTLTCALFGAFATRAEADAALSRLAITEGAGDIVARAVPGDPNYLVLIAPAATRAAAERIVETLKAAQVDAYVIPTGEHALGVSVGVFSTRDRAVAQRDRVVGFGFDARVSMREQSRTVHRVRLRDVPASALGNRTAESC